MTAFDQLATRLKAADPGWPIYRDLIAFVESQRFRVVDIEFLGRFLVSNAPLVFSGDPGSVKWPTWLPAYVAALHGMKADDPEMEGGYSGHFSGAPACPGSLFSPAGNDEELGFPLIDVPDNTYAFQANASGALFFVNQSNPCQVLYPDADRQRFAVLDTLENFTKTNIRCAIDGVPWFKAYARVIGGSLVD